MSGEGEGEGEGGSEGGVGYLAGERDNRRRVAPRVLQRSDDVRQPWARRREHDPDAAVGGTWPAAWPQHCSERFMTNWMGESLNWSRSAGSPLPVPNTCFTPHSTSAVHQLASRRRSAGPHRSHRRCRRCEEGTGDAEGARVSCRPRARAARHPRRRYAGGALLIPARPVRHTLPLCGAALKGDGARQSTCTSEPTGRARSQTRRRRQPAAARQHDDLRCGVDAPGRASTGRRLLCVWGAPTELPSRLEEAANAELLGVAIVPILGVLGLPPLSSPACTGAANLF